MIVFERESSIGLMVVYSPFAGCLIVVYVAVGSLD